ncbi:SDR family NAD(P)-dependent oxidoreductase [Arcticibacter sp. MXS-1]|uniref:SDR family NAD(P)-dependent oxidoreductase n=1 Tax=Arcticibacter sp. MXS-1 TaxID=3341726 RepID=UPI0035A8C39E
MFTLENKTAVVTGAGSGIGRAVALTFATAKAHVYVADLNAANAEDTVNEIKRQGGEASPLICDVSRQGDVVSAFQKVGKIDILVNSAGISHIGRADNTTSEDFERVFRVNVEGVYNCIFAVVPLMKANGGGAILNLASIAANIGLPDRFAYSMSKGAVYAMTMSVAKDYIQDNIRCNSISPARVHTPFVDGFLAKNYPGKEQEMFEKLSKTQPIGRMGTPDEISKLVLYLCSDEASFITGNDYAIDGGFIKLNN